MDVALLILGFSIGSNFFVYIKMTGWEELGVTLPVVQYGFHWLTPSVAGLLIGLGLSIAEFRFFARIKYPIPLAVLFLIRLIVYSLIIVVSVALVHTLFDLTIFKQDLLTSLEQTLFFMQTDMFLTLYVYLLLLGATLNFIRNIGNRFGHGILINFLIGKYRKPIEEDRIFMFVDLNSSTKIAEQLEHVKYSRFLNRCFSDLSTLLPQYDAEVYQYVGDEAVITWNTKVLKDKSQPAWLFLAFEKLLKQNSPEYIEKFGIQPTFKAAINAGPVIVTEVGASRKELAYHGDVLNTASRVLELCNELKKRLLTTSALFGAFSEQKQLSIDFATHLVLRGKNDGTDVYSIEHSMEPVVH